MSGHRAKAVTAAPHGATRRHGREISSDATGMRRRAPAKGSPLTLPEIFWWTLIAAGYVMVAVIAVSFIAQDSDPQNVRHVCEVSWNCELGRPAR